MIAITWNPVKLMWVILQLRSITHYNFPDSLQDELLSSKNVPDLMFSDKPRHNPIKNPEENTVYRESGIALAERKLFQ